MKFKKKDTELQTYKQHSEHQQKQISSLMVENESTLKINNALLHKTKLLECEIKEQRNHAIPVKEFNEKLSKTQEEGKEISKENEEKNQKETLDIPAEVEVNVKQGN